MLNENQIVEAVCKYLKQNGYEIISSCTTTQKGIDIIAESKGLQKKLLIEAKGGTSSKEGTIRFGKPFNANQVFVRVSKAFYTAVKTSIENKKSDVGIAFPDTNHFRKYLLDIKSTLDQLNINVFLVKSDLSVIKF